MITIKWGVKEDIAEELLEDFTPDDLIPFKFNIKKIFRININIVNFIDLN